MLAVPGSSNVTIIRTSDNTISTTIPGIGAPLGIDVTPDGNFVYVTVQDTNNATVIRTSDNVIVDEVAVGLGPDSFGKFISTGPQPRVANVPTLSEWGLVAMASILGIVGLMVMRRRKASA